jgi:hypothetical protein
MPKFTPEPAPLVVVNMYDTFDSVHDDCNTNWFTTNTFAVVLVMGAVNVYMNKEDRSVIPEAAKKP